MASTSVVTRAMAPGANAWALPAKLEGASNNIAEVEAPPAPPPGLPLPRSTAEEATAAAEATTPRAERTRLCLCRGLVLVLKSHYGWIAPLEHIDHRDARRRGGRIYFKKDDVVCGSSLVEGDVMTFYLYADDHGLGAEECRLEERGADAKFSFSASAPEFVPPPPGIDLTLDVADADTDASIGTDDADHASEDITSDSDAASISATGLRAPVQLINLDSSILASGPRDRASAGAPIQLINLDSYKDCDDSDSEESPVASRPAKAESTIGSAPWRKLRLPPGLAAVSPGPPASGDPCWLARLPWRRK